MVAYKYQNIFKRYCLFLCYMLLFCGCAKNKQVNTVFPETPIEPCKIAFMGFKPAIPQGQEPDLFHNTLLNTMVSSEPVNQYLTEKLSDKLYSLIIDFTDYEIINLREILTTESFKESNTDEIEVIKAVGKDFSADVVITGYIYRMRERKGSKYSVISPASAAFDIYIVNIKEGSILWKGSFNKTQKSLSENLLDLKSFIKFKGKWADVYSLAEAGLKELLDDMPFKNK